MSRYSIAKPTKTFYTGTAGANTTASALSSTNVWCNEVLVQNHPDSAARIILGSSDTQHIVMEAGDSMTLPLDNVALIHARTTASTATVNYLARK